MGSESSFKAEAKRAEQEAAGTSQPGSVTCRAGKETEDIPGSFFGQYLVDEGVISPEQLEDAVALQRENNVLLGAMARNKGFLSQTQLEAVLSEQRQVNKRFGEIALEKGWLRQEQISELIEEQSKNHCFLGEALARLGYLEDWKIHEHLERFRELERAREERLLSAIDAFEGAQQIHLAVELTRNLFYRHGFMIKALDVFSALPSHLEGECFLAAQKGRRGETSGPKARLPMVVR